MRTPACAVLFAVLAAQILTAQHASIGPQIAFGDYKEVSSNLHYRGAGIAAKATLQWKRFSGDIVFSKLKYKPSTDGTATTQFDASEIDMRLRYYITGPVSGEIGVISRKADPELEAQSVGAVTVGARMAYLLGPGVRMNLNGGLMFGSKFSGGGQPARWGRCNSASGSPWMPCAAACRSPETMDSSVSPARPTMAAVPYRRRSSSRWAASGWRSPSRGFSRA